MEGNSVCVCMCYVCVMHACVCGMYVRVSGMLGVLGPE